MGGCCTKSQDSNDDVSMEEMRYSAFVDISTESYEGPKSIKKLPNYKAPAILAKSNTYPSQYKGDSLGEELLNQ
ncbi:unnamed protein product [Blepharisma stoltei]|uniref:Uncharacterized protein n=1 Tax=Blepharisma stoltei TaxID=1481888 RepID=A0AAU9IPN6_9CILI|nr:unnamed protein product [Blepharisma stoltei]